MPLPSSGPLSISQIRNEIVNNGCGASTYSLSALAALAGFPADPDRISEFYGYACASCNQAQFCYSSVSCLDATVPNQSCVCADQVRFWVGSLGVNTILYNSCAFDPVPNGYYTYNGNCYTVSGGGGMITAVNALPNTITIYGSSFSGCNLFGWSNCVQACNANYTPYSYGCVAYYGSFTTGTYLYPPLACGFTGPNPSVYYYPGGWVQISGSNPGLIIDIGSCPCATTTTTTVPVVCHNFIATATGVMVWTDCCGVNQNQFLIAGDTFCAQVGTVFGSWLDQGTSCNC